MKFSLSILFLFITFGLFSQNKITVSKSDFLIGEATVIYYEINDFKNDSKIDFNPWRRRIECLTLDQNSPSKELEILSFRDTIIIGNENQLIGSYTVTAWDTGTYILPQHPFWIDDEEFLFESITLRVFLPKTKVENDIIESELPFQDYEIDAFYYVKKYLPWVIGGIFILLLAIWFFLKQQSKRKQKDKDKVISKLPLMERFLQEIANLESKKLLEKGQIKVHYIESSFILRHYLSEQFDLNILEQTSSQTQVLLISKGLPADLILEIQQLFNLFDSVKFAKFNPELTDSQELLIQVKTSVLKIDNWIHKDA
jgi:hypothetical protein